MTQTSGPGETAGARVFSLTRMYVRYSFAPVSAYVEKGHGPLLVAVCAGLFCMPFMMAGGGAPCCPCWEKNCTPPQGSWDSLAQPTRLTLPCFSLAAAVWATFGVTDASSCGERHFLPWQARLKALFLPLVLFFRYAFPASWQARLSTPAGWPCWPQPRHKAAVRPIFVSAAPQFRGCSVQPGCRRNSGGHPWLSLAMTNASLHGVIIPCFMASLC